MYTTEHYMFAWDQYYVSAPDDMSVSDEDGYALNQAHGWFEFDGHEYSSWYEDPSLPPEYFRESVVCPCPGPMFPPLQGPAPANAYVFHDYWATRHTRFVYDEAAEIAHREEARERQRMKQELQRRNQVIQECLSTPGYAWCEVEPLS